MEARSKIETKELHKRLEDIRKKVKAEMASAELDEEDQELVLSDELRDRGWLLEMIDEQQLQIKNLESLLGKNPQGRLEGIKEVDIVMPFGVNGIQARNFLDRLDQVSGYVLDGIETIDDSMSLHVRLTFSPQVKPGQPMFHSIAARAAELIAEGIAPVVAMDQAYQEQAIGSPAGWLVEVIRPKKGLQTYGVFETRQEAEEIVEWAKKKHPKWRTSVMVVYREDWLLEDVAVKGLDKKVEIDHPIHESLISKALEQRWSIAPDYEGGPLLLYPPPEHPCRNWACEWSPYSYKSRIIHVPKYLQAALEGHTPNLCDPNTTPNTLVDGIMGDLIKKALKQGWEIKDGKLEAPSGTEYPYLRGKTYSVQYEGEKLLYPDWFFDVMLVDQKELSVCSVFE